MNSFLFNIGSRIERGDDIYIVEGHLKERESYSLRSPSSGYIVSSPKDKVEGEFDLIVEAAKRKLIPGVDIAKKTEPLEKELARLDTELKKLIAQRNVISPDFVYIEKIQEGGKGIPYHGKEGYDRLDFHIKSAKKEIQAVKDKLDDIKYTLASKDKWYTQAEEVTSILNRVLGTSFKDYDINDAVRGWKETSAAFDEKKKADPEATRIQSTNLNDVAFLSDWIEKSNPPQDKLKELAKELKAFKSHPVTRVVENAIDDTIKEDKGKEEEARADLTPFLAQARKELEENKPLAAKKRDILVAIRNATNYSSQEEVRRPRNKKLDTPDALGIDAAIKALQESLDAKEASLESLEAAFKKFKKDINELSYDVSNDLLLFIDRKAPKGDYSFSEAEVTNLAKTKWEASQPKPVEKKDTTPDVVSLEPIAADTAAKVFVRYLRDHKDSKESLTHLFEGWVYNLGKKEHARLKLPWNRWSNGEEDPDWKKAAAAWDLKVKDIKEVLATKYDINLDGKLADNVKKLQVRWKELEDTPAAKKLPAIHREPSAEVRQRDKDLWNKLRPVISELITLVGNKVTDAILDLIDEEITGHEDFSKFKADALELLPSHLNPDRLPSLEEHLEGKKQELVALVVPPKEDETYQTILDKRKKVIADVMAFEKMIRKIKDLEGNIRALHTVWKGSMEKQSNLVKNISDNYRLVLGERELTLVSEWLSASIKFPSIAAACKKFTELNSEQDVESAFDVATLVAMEKEGMIKCLLCDSMIKEGSSEYRTFQGEICNKHSIRDIPISMMKIAAARSRCKTCGYAYIDDNKVDEHKKQGHTIVMEESNFTPASEIAPEVLKDIERSNLKEVVRRDLYWEKEFPQGLSEHKTPRAVAEAIGEDNYLDGVITELQEHLSGGDNVYDKEEIYVAAKTAADHLQEDSNYYAKLRKMEKEANLEVEVDEDFQQFVTPGHRGPDGGQKQDAANYIAGKIAGTLEDSSEATKKLIVEFITLNAPDWTEDNIDTVARIAQGAMDSEVNSPAEIPSTLPAAPMKKEAHMPFLCPKCSQGYAENKEKCPRCFIMLIDKRLSAVDGPAIPSEVGKEGNPCIGNANMDGGGTYIMPAGQPANQSANVMKEGAIETEADAARSLADRCSHCGLAGPSVKLSKNWSHMKLCSTCERDLDKCDQCRKLKTDVSRKYGPKMCKDCERHMLQRKHLRKEAVKAPYANAVEVTAPTPKETQGPKLQVGDRVRFNKHTPEHAYLGDLDNFIGELVTKDNIPLHLPQGISSNSDDSKCNDAVSQDVWGDAWAHFKKLNAQTLRSALNRYLTSLIGTTGTVRVVFDSRRPRPDGDDIAYLGTGSAQYMIELDKVIMNDEFVSADYNAPAKKRGEMENDEQFANDDVLDLVEKNLADVPVAEPTADKLEALVAEIKKAEEAGDKEKARQLMEQYMSLNSSLRVEAELGIIARIVKKPDGFHVYAETGRHMGGPYQSRVKAKERLQQVEMFKHMKGASMDFQVGDTAILNTRVGFLNEGTEVEVTACVNDEVTFIAGDIHGITKVAHLDKVSIKKEAAADLEKYQWDNKGLKNQFELGDRVKIGSVELGGATYKDKEGTIRDKVIVANDKDTEMFYLVEIDGAGSTTLPEEALHRAKKAVPQTWRASSLNEDEFVKKESVLKPNFDVTQDFIDSYDNPPSVVTTRDVTEWLEDPKQNYQYSKKDLKEIVKYLQSARIEVRVPVEKEVPEATEEAMEAPATEVDSLGVKKEAVKIKDAKGQVTEITDVNHPLVKKNLPAGTKITETDGSISEVMASKTCNNCKGEKAIICECMSDANIWLTASCAKCNDGGYIKCACTNEPN